MRHYGTLALDRGRWVMTGVEPHVVHRLKAMFLRLAKEKTQPFSFPDTAENCADLEWFLKRYPMTMSAQDHATLHKGRMRFEVQRDGIEQILQPGWQADQIIAFKPGFALYRDQAQAVEIARRLGRLLVLDDVGMGKTVTALGTILDPQYLPAAVICEAGLPGQWKEQFIDEFTTLKAHVIRGTRPYELPPADIYLFRYTNIHGWCDIAATGKFKSVVLDEIQNMRRGEETIKGRAARVFVNHAGLRIGLTATPIYGYGTEAFPIVDLIAPGFLGSYEDFWREWCTGKIVKQPDALGTYLREHHITLRRTDEDRGEGQPPANIVTIDVPFDEDVEADELALARTLAIKVTSGSFTERGQSARELDMWARRITGLGKARHVAAYVRMLVEAGRPVLLTGWHRSVYDIWLEQLADLNPVMYTGSESYAQKKRSLQAFTSGATDLLIISLRSAIGIDGLQKRCHTLVIGEMDWSPQVHKQIIGRLRRPGQQNQVDVMYCIASGGADPLMVSVLGLKADQQRGIVDPLSGVTKVHSDTSRIEALARLYLAKTDKLAADANAMLDRVVTQHRGAA